jgi:hypothetical protein
VTVRPSAQVIVSTGRPVQSGASEVRDFEQPSPTVRAKTKESRLERIADVKARPMPGLLAAWSRPDSRRRTWTATRFGRALIRKLRAPGKSASFVWRD